MIELTIPGRGALRIEHLVTDVNGTLAVDGVLIDGLVRRIASLRDRLEVHMLTADTHGRQANINEQLNLKATRVPPGNEASDRRRNSSVDLALRPLSLSVRARMTPRCSKLLRLEFVLCRRKVWQ